MPTTLAFNFFPTRSSGAALKAGGPLAKVCVYLLWDYGGITCGWGLGGGISLGMGWGADGGWKEVGAWGSRPGRGGREGGKEGVEHSSLWNTGRNKHVPFGSGHRGA